MLDMSFKLVTRLWKSMANNVSMIKVNLFTSEMFEKIENSTHM